MRVPRDPVGMYEGVPVYGMSGRAKLEIVEATDAMKEGVSGAGLTLLKACYNAAIECVPDLPPDSIWALTEEQVGQVLKIAMESK